ncbi:MAG: Hpt domain-containing protein [[Clostridium] scindens]
MKFLSRLFQDPSMENWEQGAKDKDYGEAFTAAHTRVKGLLANMGLTPRSSIRVCAIVEPLRLGEAREDYPDMYREIEDEFQRVEGLRDELFQ